MKYLRDFFQKFKVPIITLICLGGIAFSYLIIDVLMRCFLWKIIGFVSYKSFSPLAFSLSYVLVLLFIFYLFPKAFKPIYITTIILSNFYLLAQMIHFEILDNFFSVTSLFAASEGMDYLGYALSVINFKMILIVLLSILSMIIVLFIIKKSNVIIFDIKKKIKFLPLKILVLLAIVLVFVMCRITAVYKLGKSVPYYTWNAWDTPRNIYDDYNNKNRSLMVSGIYEYLFRDIYVFVDNKLNVNNKENIKDVNAYIDKLDITLKENNYTNIFKDKNLIMIMFESIDTWMVTPDVMPTLFKMQQEGLNFTNRYAPFFGGSMTINSEFASVSSLYSVLTDKAIYNYDENDYQYSLPNLFKQEGYTVNSIHMNKGSFYNRINFHKALGFENHYALANMDINGRFDYDSQLASVDEVYKLITPSDKFMTFITTFSAHIPYDNNAICKEKGDDFKELHVDGNKELSCLRMLANETDKLLEVLIERLEEDDLLDDTVLVMFADHYAYGYSEETTIKGETDSNLIQHTPFVIWSPNIDHEDIDIINDTADIPVTILNMFGIEYNPKLYMGTDIFSNNHEQFVYFTDHSWYDGEYYSKDGGESDYIKDISSLVNKKIDINRKILASDFYRYYK